MKNDKMKQSLERELSGVRVSGNLKRRILDEAAVSRAPQKKSAWSIRPLAIAAAVMVTFGLSAGMIALRTEKPDLSATPLSQNVQSNSVWVWKGADGRYHGESDCGGQEDMSRAKIDNARAEGLKACSKCFEEDAKAVEDLVWAVRFGMVYHVQPDCSGMENAMGILEIEAKTLGLMECGLCMGGEMIESWPEYEEARPTPMPTAMPTPMPTTQPTPEAEEIGEDETLVWALGYGNFYHAEEHCSGMENASAMTELEAVMCDLKPCVTCTERTLWTADGGLSYHLAQNCGDMEDAKAVTLQPGDNSCQMGCLVCAAGGIPVWTTENGALYHWNEDCSGMVNAKQIMQSEALAVGKQMCSVCFGVHEVDGLAVFVTEESEDNSVWMTDGGVFYHSQSNCSGMANACAATVVEALTAGKEPCPTCAKPFSEVWAAESGRYYHLDEECSGLEDAQKLTGSEVAQRGLRLCPQCKAELAQVAAKTE